MEISGFPKSTYNPADRGGRQLVWPPPLPGQHNTAPQNRLQTTWLPYTGRLNSRIAFLLVMSSRSSSVMSRVFMNSTPSVIQL